MEDFLWVLMNGSTAWIVFIAHLFGAWNHYPFYNENRSGNLYDFGFLIGATTLFLIIFSSAGDS